MKYPKLERTNGDAHTFMQSTGHYVTVTTEQIEHMLSQAKATQPKPKRRTQTPSLSATEA